MKRWRTDGSACGRCVAAALAFLLASGAAERAAFADAGSPVRFQSILSRPKLERIGDYLRNEIASGKIPGAVILIQQHGTPVYSECFGVRDVESRRPMMSNTIFRLYSMSKPITSVAIMMLVEDGKLKLDDPVEKYIPAFADAKVGIDKLDDNGQPTSPGDPQAIDEAFKPGTEPGSGYNDGAAAQVIDGSAPFSGIDPAAASSPTAGAGTRRSTLTGTGETY